MTLSENTLFDSRYKLLRKLGEGGYSEVWLAEDTSAKINMVLKIFLPSAQLDEGGMDLFRKEYSMVYNLNHSNLLKCTYYGVYEGSPYLVMPFYEQGSAESLIGKCDEKTAWSFLHDVASGLALLHEQDPPIIHQDIKPGNVLIDDGKFIITDFGISFNAQNALFGSEGGEVVVQGTKPYMPPEKFQGDGAPLMAGDIWALGASVYELLTGVLPYRAAGGSVQEEGDPVPRIQGNYSNDLKKLVYQCMEYQPWKRPFAADIAAIAASKADVGSLKKSGVYSDSIVVKKKTKPIVKALITAGIVIAVLGCALGVYLLVKSKGNKVDPQVLLEQRLDSLYHCSLDSANTGMKDATYAFSEFDYALNCFDTLAQYRDYIESHPQEAASIYTTKRGILETCCNRIDYLMDGYQNLDEIARNRRVADSKEYMQIITRIDTNSKITNSLISKYKILE